MTEITLIFPNQLFEYHPAVAPKRMIYLVEEFLFFRAQSFHKQKLILMRAAMKNYASYLEGKGLEVTYINSNKMGKRGDLFSLLAEKKIEKIHYADFSDEWLKQDLENGALRYKWSLLSYQTPEFLTSEKEINLFFKGKNSFSMAPFYAYQRKRLNILMENQGPVGGKFSFDLENRKRLPKKCIIPLRHIPPKSSLIDEVIDSIELEFPDAIGEARPFSYPVTFDEARNALSDFIRHRLAYFGDYEDAIKESDSFLFHSVLSPLINIGLLTPNEMIHQILLAYENKRAALNSVEGFIRQLIGWREFMRASYLLKGNTQRTSNFFCHKNPLPKGFWDGTTGIFPVDQTIKKILKTGYCHHIERLMILGNFLLLTETDPKHVYSWFMANFIDAYDWVMVPNVYGMSQYADQGSITTKPYISGANYILKMSDYQKGDWCDIWDGLFWRFIQKNQTFFENNPRSSVLVKLLSKNLKTASPKISLAEKWLYARNT